MEDRIWEMFAYAARYGKQQLSEVRTMPMAELERFIGEISKIVKEENKPKKQEG